MDRIACLPSPPVPATFKVSPRSSDGTLTSVLTTSDEPNLRGEVPDARLRLVVTVLHWEPFALRRLGTANETGDPAVQACESIYMGDSVGLNRQANLYHSRAIYEIYDDPTIFLRSYE